MAKFIHGTEINLRIEELIRHADKYLWFISPYIKLHEKIKDELKKKKSFHDLEIVIVFGKNEQDPSKSINTDDVSFLKEFPNVKICYEKNLHAKYYASEDFSIITSMNLHEFSHNTNKEVGIIMQPKNAIKHLTNLVMDESDLGDEALKHFSSIVNHSERLFVKTPEYSSSLLGIKKSYKGSNVEVDNLSQFFGKGSYKTQGSMGYQKPVQSFQKMGYCIRTGVQIPFDINRPLSNEAFKTWSQFGNPDYPENYCHFSGEVSNGETCVNRPILKKNWNKAKA